MLIMTQMSTWKKIFPAVCGSKINVKQVLFYWQHLRTNMQCVVSQTNENVPEYTLLFTRVGVLKTVLRTTDVGIQND